MDVDSLVGPYGVDDPSNPATINPALLQAPNGLNHSTGTGTRAHHNVSTSYSPNTPSLEGEGMPHGLQNSNTTMPTHHSNPVHYPTANTMSSPPIITGVNNDVRMQNGAVNTSSTSLQPPRKFIFGLPPSTWEANESIVCVLHNHFDGSPCTNHAEHTCLAFGQQDEAFLAERTKLINKLTSSTRAENHQLEKELNRALDERDDARDRYEQLGDQYDHLERQYDDLKRDHDELIEKYESLQKSIPSDPPRTTKRKKDDQEPTDPERPTPAKKTARSFYIPIIGYAVIDTKEKLSLGVEYTVLETINFRPGFPIIDAGLEWCNDSGMLRPSQYAHKCTTSRTLPVAAALSGTGNGAQLIPAIVDEVNDLVDDASTPGNWAALITLWEIRSVVNYRHYLRSRYPNIVPALNPVESAILDANVEPIWSRFSYFHDGQKCERKEDTTQHFDANPLEIPSVPTPSKTGATDVEIALDVLAHYNHTAHLGILVSDSGFVDLTSIQSRRLFMSFTPEAPDQVSDYRCAMISFLTALGLYQQLKTAFSLEISPARTITRFTKDDYATPRAIAKHLAACGITVEEVEVAFQFAMHYCLQAVNVHWLPEKVRRHYAEAFRLGQLRLL
ncbi:hypothetical protein VNI00_016144 [Paramarasmius palmivorus]|uniref:Uncharacterized protein n=1 Tax=Paramarasmius palmivorus TaxID=297713 RepID=A0AAW0BFH6_9AGAR